MGLGIRDVLRVDGDILCVAWKGRSSGVIRLGRWDMAMEPTICSDSGCGGIPLYYYQGNLAEFRGKYKNEVPMLYGCRVV